MRPGTRLAIRTVYEAAQTGMRIQPPRGRNDDVGVRESLVHDCIVSLVNLP